MNWPEHIAATTFHGRQDSPLNSFTYSVDFMICDAEAPCHGPSLFSRNRFNLASLHDRDHGGPPKAGRGAPWARQVLSDWGIITEGPVLLLSQPRFWGYVFNPVSFWLCYDQGELRAVIAEVTNTFGDRHSYVCAREDRGAIGRQDLLTAQKVFHVSPFQPIEGSYRFRFDITDERVAITIQYQKAKGGMVATLTGDRRPMTNRALVWSAVRRPFGSWRVLALIHWQALKLWWKGASYRNRPEPPSEEVSN